ncbi:NUDIX hydrolase [Methylomicrobium sp. RS1]|uniref:NUDIX hydrolase n=1 Tax=Candidatus Methylomicrobium oryzae TaxID=2802053 RepID=UPI003019B4E2
MRNKENPSFPEPMIGVGGLLFNRQNQVLLIKRNKPPRQGLWSVPGGKLEAGEGLTECCRREIREETGLDVNVLSLIAVVERRIENFHYVIVDFLVELRNENENLPLAASDVSEARWIGLENIDDYPLVEGLPEIIRRAAGRRSGEGFYKNCAETDFIL